MPAAANAEVSDAETEDEEVRFFEGWPDSKQQYQDVDENGLSRSRYSMTTIDDDTTNSAEGLATIDDEEVEAVIDLCSPGRPSEGSSVAVQRDDDDVDYYELAEKRAKRQRRDDDEPLKGAKTTQKDAKTKKQKAPTKEEKKKAPSKEKQKTATKKKEQDAAIATAAAAAAAAASKEADRKAGALRRLAAFFTEVFIGDRVAILYEDVWWHALVTAVEKKGDTTLIALAYENGDTESEVEIPGDDVVLLDGSADIAQAGVPSHVSARPLDLIGKTFNQKFAGSGTYEGVVSAIDTEREKPRCTIEWAETGETTTKDLSVLRTVIGKHQQKSGTKRR